MNRIIPYGRQDITEEDIAAVNKVLRSDFLTTGPKVQEFEEKFAHYIGSKYAVAVSNGTAALHLSTIALGVQKDSTVITTPITFSASANCARYCGGNVEFCDIDNDTLLIDLEKLEEKLIDNPKVKYSGIIAVDFAGSAVDMEKVREIADRFKLWVLEDACHAPGGYFIDSNNNKQQCGNGKFAECAIFSFHPVKHIACGEGGMITTNDEDIYNQLLSLRSHGMVYQGNPALMENHGGWYMEMQTLGYNYRLTDISCALGISQLERANENLKKRREIAKRYDDAFKDSNIQMHKPQENIGHAYHLYVVELNNRKEVYDKLREFGIYCQVHYVPVHLMPYYRQLGNKPGDFPVSEKYYNRCLSLPMYPSLEIEQQDFVIEKMLKFAK